MNLLVGRSDCCRYDRILNFPQKNVRLLRSYAFIYFDFLNRDETRTSTGVSVRSGLRPSQEEITGGVRIQMDIKLRHRIFNDSVTCQSQSAEYLELDCIQSLVGRVLGQFGGNMLNVLEIIILVDFFGPNIEMFLLKREVVRCIQQKLCGSDQYRILYSPNLYQPGLWRCIIAQLCTFEPLPNDGDGDGDGVSYGKYGGTTLEASKNTKAKSAFRGRIEVHL
ncbi:hypothetical protein F2P81_019603 [Scophthalmus maximus]|uniref:Uncharacterized protein n=1 Tax=Scophthalmus maximus TaxID=52904 RepID=A0A6A4RZZ2_SCOMX|nr:hypothetical protein F2P81_019603 [Scophthalmus maximus]